MLNIVTGKKGYPSAVLIRGVSGISGPGKVTRRLKITKALNKKLALKSSGLWIESRGIKVPRYRLHAKRRIGVEYAGKYWASRKWRFIVS